MTTEETPRRRVCPNCSTISETPGEYCPHCGTPFPRKAQPQGTGRSVRRNAIITFLAVLLLVAVALGALFATGTLPPRLTKTEYEEKMQPLFTQANKETTAVSGQIGDASESVSKAKRGFRSQISTVNHMVDEFETINPPSEIDDEHESLIEAYRRVAKSEQRAVDSTEWGASDSGQEALSSSMDEAGSAESRIRDRGDPLLLRPIAPQVPA